MAMSKSVNVIAFHKDKGQTNGGIVALVTQRGYNQNNVICLHLLV